MKVFIYFLVFFLQQLHANADCAWFSSLNLGPACISLTQLYNATATLCAQKDNTALWQQVIECHDPISEDVIFCFVSLLAYKTILTRRLRGRVNDFIFTRLPENLENNLSHFCNVNGFP